MANIDMEKLTTVLNQLSTSVAEQTKLLLEYGKFGTPEDIQKLLRFLSATLKVMNTHPEGMEMLAQVGAILKEVEALNSLKNAMTEEDLAWLNSLDTPPE